MPEIEMNLSISMLSEMTKSQNFGLILSGYKVAAGLAEGKLVAFRKLFKNIKYD